MDDLDADMSEDESFFAPNRAATPTREPRPREHLWAIRRNGRQYDCELLDHGTWGIEVQVLRDLEWFYGHRCESRELDRGRPGRHRLRAAEDVARAAILGQRGTELSPDQQHVSFGESLYDPAR